MIPIKKTAPDRRFFPRRVDKRSREEMTAYLANHFRYNTMNSWNGRSSGYLVLYQGGTEPSGYRSFCARCGQKNYTSIAETGKRCGVCNKEARIDFSKPPMRIFSYPGWGVDMDEDFEDWSLYELQQRTELVQEFDRLADDVVAEALYIAQNHSVEERIVYIPTTERVLA